MEAFAFEVWRRFVTGETAQQLATELGIPVNRIEQRVRAAARYRISHEGSHPSETLGRTVGSYVEDAGHWKATAESSRLVP